MRTASTFESLGCIFEIKTSNFGNGPIDLDYLKRSIKNAEGVVDQCERFYFLFPLNEISDEAEAVLLKFQRKADAVVKWYGPVECENFIRALGKTNKELSKQIQQVILAARRKKEL